MTTDLYTYKLSMFPYRRRLYGMNKRGLLHINAAALFCKQDTYFAGRRRIDRQRFFYRSGLAIFS